MKLLDMLINDSLVLYSVVGLAILFGIGAFYIYLFLKNINQNN